MLRMEAFSAAPAGMAPEMVEMVSQFVKHGTARSYVLYSTVHIGEDWRVK
jgi:hypothetical protein